MKKLFKDVQIGETFFTSFDGSAKMIYKKINKSTGECIDQEGYGNKRAIGGHYKFAPFKSVNYVVYVKKAVA